MPNSIVIFNAPDLDPILIEVDYHGVELIRYLESMDLLASGLEIEFTDASVEKFTN